MNKWYMLIILLQSSFLWSASAASGDTNRMHLALKEIDSALTELHTDMQDIKGNITATAQYSSQLPLLVERTDALVGIGQSLLGELRQQNVHLEISAKAQALSALIAHHQYAGLPIGKDTIFALARDLVTLLQPQ